MLTARRAMIADAINHWARERGQVLPMPAPLLASLMVSLLEGLETEVLIGVEAEDVPPREALEACIRLVERFEQPAS